jgi:hypothetical protein
MLSPQNLAAKRTEVRTCSRPKPASRRAVLQTYVAQHVLDLHIPDGLSHVHGQEQRRAGNVSLTAAGASSGPPRVQTGRSGVAPKTAAQVMLRAVMLTPARAGS